MLWHALPNEGLFGIADWSSTGAAGEPPKDGSPTDPIREFHMIKILS